MVSHENKAMIFMSKSQFTLIVLAAFVLLGLATSCNSISTGSVGVVKHFGAVQYYVLNEGINFTRPWPFASVTEVDIKIGTTEAEATAASKDLQGVKTKVAIQWSITAGGAPKVLQGFGSEEELETAILAPAIQESVKSVSARYAAEELITKRGQVKNGIELELANFVKKTLAEKNAAGGIHIANVAVTDFHFSKEFDGSIEAKVRAEQDALRAENEKKKRITNAEAAAAEVRTAADADAHKRKAAADASAYAIEKESISRADAIKREAAALAGNPQLIELRKVEQWNGALPTYTGGPIPIMNLK